MKYTCICFYYSKFKIIIVKSHGIDRVNKGCTVDELTLQTVQIVMWEDAQIHWSLIFHSGGQDLVVAMRDKISVK